MEDSIEEEDYDEDWDEAEVLLPPTTDKALEVECLTLGAEGLTLDPEPSTPTNSVAFECIARVSLWPRVSGFGFRVVTYFGFRVLPSGLEF